MKTYISMLRGVNVGGKVMHMAELKRLFESLSLIHVETFLQSGNVVFDAEPQDLSALGKMLERQIERSFGYPVPVLLRDIQDMHRILTGNPFLTGRSEDPGKLHVTFFAQAPAEEQWNSLNAPDSGEDEFIPGMAEVFLFCPNGYGRTKLTNTFFEKKLNLPATTRNWNTVNALHRLADGRQPHR